MERLAHSRADDWFRPAWSRAILAASLAGFGLLLPQKMPLVWYPLNDPGEDTLYLEIACSSDQVGSVQIFYNATRGINELESIYWPISATAETYTYTFPLPDAPLTELRLDPVANGGALTVTNFRIIDRRGREVRRFTKDDIVSIQQIAAVEPLVAGWKIISAAGSNDPFANIRLAAPIIAKDIDHRNLLRCLLSTGFLALMLWILLLAVLFALYRPASARDLLKHLAFMAALAIMFSTVGNRGLIKNFVRYARFVPPPVPAGASLEVDVAINHPTSAQLFWDAGRGFNETDSARASYEPHQHLQTLRFPLPSTPPKKLRFDPIDGEARLAIRGIRVVDATRRTLVVLPNSSFEAGQEIVSIKDDGGSLAVTTAAGAKDPILNLSAEAAHLVEEALAAANRH